MYVGVCMACGSEAVAVGCMRSVEFINALEQNQHYRCCIWICTRRSDDGRDDAVVRSHPALCVFDDVCVRKILRSCGRAPSLIGIGFGKRCRTQCEKIC